MVGEVALADGEETLYRCLELVVNPDAAHSVVDGREDHHRVVVVHAVLLVGEFARVDVGDFLIHVEEVAVTLAHYVEAEAVDGFREVKEDCKASVVYAEALVATFFRRA